MTAFVALALRKNAKKVTGVDDRADLVLQALDRGLVLLDDLIGSLRFFLR